MTAIALPLRTSPRQLWTLTSRLLLMLALLALLYLVARIALAAEEGRFSSLATDGMLWRMAATAAVYLIGHGFRILRLALLIGGWRVGFRVVASFHLMTAAVSLTAPLKLGEIYRVVELSNIVGSLIRAVVITWLERVFDALMIFIVLAFAVRNDMGAAFGAVTALTAAFIAVTIIAVVLVPENLRRLAVVIICRYDTPRTVPLLRTIDLVRRAVLKAPSLVRNKVATLITLSALIWTCEITCFALMFPALAQTLDAAGAALLAFLSAVTRGEMLLGQLSAGATEILPYLAATQAPLALLGAIAAVHYVRFRFR